MLSVRHPSLLNGSGSVGPVINKSHLLNELHMFHSLQNYIIVNIGRIKP